MFSAEISESVGHQSNKLLCHALAWAFVIVLSVPAHAGDKAKDEETLKNAGNVLQQMLKDQNVPSDVIAKSQCVIVLPDVKKFGIGIGGSGGRGPMVCRQGTGRWSAPAMYRISSVSAGLQIGGTSSDYVLLVMDEKGMNTILNGKTKLGSDATAAAGPSGAKASAVSGSDILTYGRAKGLFAGVSLSGASIEPDHDANQRMYGKAMTPQEILESTNVPAPSGAHAMLSLLDSKYARLSN